MIQYNRFRPAKKIIYADECIRGGFIGVDYGISMDPNHASRSLFAEGKTETFTGEAASIPHERSASLLRRIPCSPIRLCGLPTPPHAMPEALAFPNLRSGSTINAPSTAVADRHSTARCQSARQPLNKSQSHATVGQRQIVKHFSRP
jgi:hypothetical protein